MTYAHRKFFDLHEADEGKSQVKEQVLHSIGVMHFLAPDGLVFMMTQA
jgi:hypothetical protein